jgi:peptidoglycan/xylan/chitin deacetylase (PgdA/CDA1 family)
MVRWLDPVAAALDAAPAPVQVFFRDDDAGWRDDRLHPLLDLFSRRGLPLDLAVIPCELHPRLARELRARAADGVALHQHGYAHRNHEPEGRKHEFGPSRSRGQQRRDIEAGRALLAEQIEVEPIFTPPWNRCTRETAECLVELGFEVLSREAKAAPLGVAGLRELPVHIDWFAHDHGTRLEPDALMERLAGRIAAGSPVGIMFHHPVMDDAEMDRAAQLLRLLAGHDRVVAVPMMAVDSPPCSSAP